MNKKRSERSDLKEREMIYILRKNIKTKRPCDKLNHTKIGPYKIAKKLGPVTFKLELSKTMKIHSVFHVALLEPAPRNAKPGPVDIDEETKEPLYEVEEIKGHQLINEKPHYLIHWKGYEQTEDTWEPEENLTPKLLQTYRQSLASVRASPGPPKRVRPPTLRPQPTPKRQALQELALLAAT
jgi:hypothetical protein